MDFRSEKVCFLCGFAALCESPLSIFPKPYLVGMKLIAGGVQDEEDIRNLFIVMTHTEKDKAAEIAKLIRKDKNLSRILNQRKNDSLGAPYKNFWLTRKLYQL